MNQAAHARENSYNNFESYQVHSNQIDNRQLASNALTQGGFVPAKNQNNFNLDVDLDNVKVNRLPSAQHAENQSSDNIFSKQYKANQLNQNQYVRGNTTGAEIGYR